VAGMAGVRCIFGTARGWCVLLPAEIPSCRISRLCCYSLRQSRWHLLVERGATALAIGLGRVLINPTDVRFAPKETDYHPAAK
jgi:hypothetical protein